MLLVLLLALGARAALAQQVICERRLGRVVPATGFSNIGYRRDLITIATDSVLLPVITSSSRFVAPIQSRLALVWLDRTKCDTVTFVQIAKDEQFYDVVSLMETGRSILVLSNIGASTIGPTGPYYQLQSYTRQGRLRWTQKYQPRSYEAMQSLMAGPARSSYFTGVSSAGTASSRLVKADSLGVIQWQRIYDRFNFTLPCYTKRGTLLLAGDRQDANGETYGQVLEVNQRGDSLTSRVVLHRPVVRTSHLNVRPLRDGGFLITGSMDSLATASYPFYVRLDENLNVRWTYIHRKDVVQSIDNEEIGHGLELADGTLLGVFWQYKAAAIQFLRLSAAGELLTTYFYTPAVPLSYCALTPLAADSSFVLAGQQQSLGGIYYSNLRIPGLPRVLPLPPVPPAQVFLAARPPALAWPGPAYPNPASTSLHVPYTLPVGTTTAELVAYDALGRAVWHQSVGSAQAEAQVDVQGWAAGLYQLTLVVGGRVVSQQRISITHN